MALRINDAQDKKRIVVTGAAGFAGWHLTNSLVKKGYKVYAIVRPGSSHNGRLKHIDCNRTEGELIEIPIDLYNSEILDIRSLIKEQCDWFFHLSWKGDRDEIYSQLENVDVSLKMVEVASALGCSVWIGTGSQAEYGNVSADVKQDEMIIASPNTAYGAAKLATCYLTKRRCQQLKIKWIWGRIFSLIGRYEPEGRLIPDLICSLENKRVMVLTSCEHNWDYLDATDCAEALILLAEKGREGEIYNIASGDVHKLKFFVEKISGDNRKHKELIEYDINNKSAVSLQPTIKKIKQDTGWNPRIPFEESIIQYKKN